MMLAVVFAGASGRETGYVRWEVEGGPDHPPGQATRVRSGERLTQHHALLVLVYAERAEADLFQQDWFLSRGFERCRAQTQALLRAVMVEAQKIDDAFRRQRAIFPARRDQMVRVELAHLVDRPHQP